MASAQVGTNVLRFEGEQKITGRSQYIDDIDFGEFLFGLTVRSPIAKGILKNITFNDGVPWDEITIVTAKDINGCNIVDGIIEDQPFLVEKNINHRHEAIVLLAHANRDLLKKAQSLIHFDIEELSPVFAIDEALDNAISTLKISKGDCSAAFATQAGVIVEGAYETQAQEQLYIECQGMVASFDDGILLVHGSMQCPFYVHGALKKLFKFSDEQVRVIQADTGGAFGGKEEYPSVIAGHAALLAIKSKKRVKIIYERCEDLQATTKRHPAQIKIKSLTDETGKLQAIDIDIKLNGGAYATTSPVVLSRGSIHALGVYYCPNVCINGIAVATNMPPFGAFRGFGAPQTIFAIERHMDRIARVMNIAPEEIRRRNFIANGQSTATSQIIKEKFDLNCVLDKALQESNFQEKNAAFKRLNQQNSTTKFGIGLASFWHGAGFTGSGERHLASKVTIKYENKRIVILSSSIEMGQGTNTIFRQIVADALNISSESIDLHRPDTQRVSDSGPTVASRTCMIVGDLLKVSAEKMVLLLQKADMLQEKYDEKDFHRAAQHYVKKFASLVVDQQYKTPQGMVWNEKNYTGDAYPCFVRAVYVAEVKVDLLTYESTLLRMTAVQEVGKVINPILAAGQIEGGIVQGLGFALMEKVVWRDGSMANAQLTNYIIPTAIDAPEIKVIFQEGLSDFGPWGAKGIGELPLDGTAAAIISAIDNATGLDLRHIPLMPEDLLATAQDKI